MKKVLITGANSYIGDNVAAYLRKFPNDFQVEIVDMIGDAWKQKSFSGFDAIFHVAGIAHSDSGKISAEKEKIYRAVNTDLTVETAIKAKTEGVKQFVFMSSAIVYGDSAPIGKQKLIDRSTTPCPANCYGDSKLQAEIGIQKLCASNFRVCVLRPPMIYGKRCKGNYPVLAKMALKLPVFPAVDNCRSMLYIENLCEFVKLMIENEEQGVFFPQNEEYSNTSKLVAMIAKTHGKKVHLTKAFNWGLYLIRPFSPLVDKAFGSLSYSGDISKYSNRYCLYSLEESINRIEGEKV